MRLERPRPRSSLTHGLVQDVRLATRLLLKHRLSTILTLLILAFGLGVNIAVFTAANAWLVTPYPYPQAGRLVNVEAHHIKGDIGAHYRDFLDWRARNTVFEEIAIFWRSNCVLAGGGSPERVECEVTTAGATRVLGVGPVAGRFFTGREDAPGGEAVALVSDSTWRRRFGGRPDILGTVAIISGQPRTIIGVMPDRAALPGRRPAFWLPLRGNPSAPHGGQQYYVLKARLKPDVTLEQARANMTQVALALEREDPASNAGWRAVVTSAQSSARERSAGTVALLFTITGCLLLLVSANVAGMLLVRSALRAKELAVRTALGAGRWRLARQALVEGVLLGGAGGALGLLVAGWVLLAADAFLPNQELGTMPRFEWPVVLFAAAVSILTGVLFALWPASRVSRVNLNAALKGGGFRSDRRGARTRFLSGLVVVEVALAMALLVAAGLLTKDLASILTVDTGVRPEGVVTFYLRPPRGQSTSDAQRPAITSQVLERLRAAPDIEAVAAIGTLPMGGDKTGGLFEVHGRVADPTAPSPRAILHSSTPGYFGALGIPVLQGRDFQESDRENTVPVAIVNERLARQYIPDRSPLGERLRIYGRSYTIVGVVGSIRHDGPGHDPAPEIYRPLAQDPSSAMSFVVRAAGDPTRVMAVVRQVVADIDPHLPVERLRTMEQVIHDSLSRPRLNAQVLTGFALFGLALALTGLYGVVAFSTGQRTREIAIRVSLGATAGQVMRLVLWHGIRLAAMGVGLGIPLALGLSHILSSILSATDPRDAVVLVVVSGAVTLAALAATYLPARRALRVDPIVALRCE